MMRGRGQTGWLRLASFVVALAAGSPALAQVTQTDAAKTPLPQPIAAAELAIVDDSWAWNANTLLYRDASGATPTLPLRYGDFYAPPAYPQFVTGDALSLSGLFKWRKEAIDPALDAKTGPGYLSARCGFSAELLLVGGNCQATFGWYNVLDPTSKTPPATAEIYPLIAAPHDALKCVEGDGITPKKDGFCPLAWDNRGPYDLSVLRWVPKSFSSGDLSQDPRYQGGYVAFAMVGAPQKCPQSKYSMYEHNQRNSYGEPWVTSLIYHSTRDPSGIYIAFEDLPMSPSDWKKDSANGTGADGDFNDYVVYVSRTSCPGEVDPACVDKSCPDGETCRPGACTDPCSGVVCPDNALCVEGTCSSPSSGAGGTASAASGGTSSMGTAAAGMGEAGEDSAAAAFSGGAAGDDNAVAGEDDAAAGATGADGADARGGATSGVVTPGNSPQKSSSCAYAALPSGQCTRAWLLLGLAFGLASLRRRRRTQSPRRRLSR